MLAKCVIGQAFILDTLAPSTIQYLLLPTASLISQVKTSKVVFVKCEFQTITFWNVSKLYETLAPGYAADRYTTVHMYNSGITLGSACGA